MLKQPSSPPPELFRVRTFVIENTPEAHKSHLDTLYPPTMSHHSANGHLDAPSTPNGRASPSPASTIRLVPAEQARNSPVPTEMAPRRIVSARMADFESPVASSVAASGAGTSEAEPAEGWSSAVGKATLGKSGRMIEKLTQERDRFKREAEYQKALREEGEARLNATENGMKDISAMLSNLETAYEMEQATVARKDRKIEELQAELQRFEVRLKEAVRAKTTAETERYEVFEVCKKERVQYTEIALQATTERDAMSSSIKRIEESYGTQVKDIRKLIKDQAKQQNHTFRLHHDKCKKYDKEIADLTQKYERVEYQYRTYKERQESVFKDIKKKALDNEEKNQELQEKATELVGNLKWALNVNRDVRRPDDEEKKPPG